MKAKTRNGKYDFYKFLLMFGVIWGHTVTALKAGAVGSAEVVTFLRLYDMPMFALISGIFLRKSIEKHSFMENTLNKIGMILLPVVVWNLLFSVTLNKSIFFGRFWFLWAIFYSSIIILLIDKLFSFNNAVKCFAFIGGVALCHTLFGGQNTGFLLIPSIIGYYMPEIKPFVLKRKAIFISLSTVIFIGLYAFWSSEFNVWNLGTNVLKNENIVYNICGVLFRTLIGLAGIVTVKTLFDFLYEKCEKYFSPAIKYTSFIGQNTLELYILQTLFVETFGAMLIIKLTDLLGFNPFMFNLNFTAWIIAPIVTVFSLTLIGALIYYLKKIPFAGKYLFGIPLGKIICQREKRR